MRSDKKNLIVDLTFDFSLDVINFSEKLRELKKFEMSSQFFRSGTSVGANTREAQNAESKKDFIHKFKIAAKEADEVEYWLELCEQSEHYPSSKKLIDKLKPIIKIYRKLSLHQKEDNFQITESSNFQIELC